MATISITKTYADGEVLLESDLDHIKDDVETFINVTKLNDDNLQSGGITASDKLADGSISTAKLAASVVTNAKINDDAVTTAKILDANVTTAKIADANITTAKILDANVTTAKIADANVTGAKIAAATITGSNIASNTIDGNSLLSNTNIPGIATTIGSKYAAVAAGSIGSDLQISSGSFTSSASTVVNNGITASHFGTGVYILTFSPTFASRPMVVATANSSSTAMYFTSVTGSAATVNTSSGTDEAFDVIVVGPR